MLFHRSDDCLEATPTQSKVLGLYYYFLVGPAQPAFVVRWVLFLWSLYRYKRRVGRGGGNSDEVVQLGLRGDGIGMQSSGTRLFLQPGVSSLAGALL